MVPPSEIARSMIAPKAILARLSMSASAGSKTIRGWVLPSPACAITATRTSYFSEIRSIPSTRSGSAGRGTPTSSSRRLPSRSTAGIANRRAAVKASPSSGSSVVNTSDAPASVHAAAMISISRRRSTPAESDRAMSIAAASRSKPIFIASSTAPIDARSMNSSIDGRRLRVMARMAAVASRTEPNEATTVLAGGWAGIRRTVISVMMPSVPSLPTNNLVNDSPATSFSRGPPSLTAVPSARTTSRPST